MIPAACQRIRKNERTKQDLSLFEKSDEKRTMHMSRCAPGSDYSFAIIKVLAFLIALPFLANAFTPRLYLRENYTRVLKDI